MSEGVQSLTGDERGLTSFARLLAIHRAAVDPRGLRHELGHWSAVDADDLIAARQAAGWGAGEDGKLGLIYPAGVALADARVTVDGKRVPVTAGMMATAGIRAGWRSLLSYLLSPIDEATQEAGKER